MVEDAMESIHKETAD